MRWLLAGAAALIELYLLHGTQGEAFIAALVVLTHYDLTQKKKSA